jgi:hypothetical protein
MFTSTNIYVGRNPTADIYIAKVDTGATSARDGTIVFFSQGVF